MSDRQVRLQVPNPRGAEAAQLVNAARQVQETEGTVEQAELDVIVAIRKELGSS